MSLGYALRRIIEEYPFARTEPFRGHALTSVIRVSAPGELKAALGEGGSDLVYKGSAGQGIWAAVPWVAALDPAVTERATSGYYVVYLFHAREPVVHLSLLQATAAALQEFGDRANEVLAERAGFIRRRLPDYAEQLPVHAIELGSGATYPLGYGAGHAMGFTYRLDRLPGEEHLRRDLALAVRAYRALTFRGGLDALPDAAEIGAEAGDLAEARRLRMHLRTERNPRAARLVRRRHGTRCQACGLDFRNKYGPLGAGFIEVHHLRPVATLREGEVAFYDIARDFAVLCANCHRMIHRQADPSDLEGLRDRLRAAGLERELP